MAARSNVWAAMYGADEDQDHGETKARTSQDPNQAAFNQRRFLSAQPPFATDDEELTHARTQQSSSSVSRAGTHEAPETHDMGHGHTQPYHEMFGSAIDGTYGEVLAKRKKPSSQSTAASRHLYPNSAFIHEPATKPTPNANGIKDYGGADLSADMADVTEFAFWNNVQRCETLLGALKDNLEICKESMDAEVVAKMADRLQDVVGGLNKRP